MHRERSRRPRLFSTTAYVLAGTLLGAPVLPHGGGLNSAGCHNDNVNGGYHCHRNGEDGEGSVDAEVLLAALVAGGLVYLVLKRKKNRRVPVRSISGLPPARVVDVPKGDAIRLGLMPATNSRGRVDGVGLQLRFRF